jgi:hypothetical protein
MVVEEDPRHYNFFGVLYQTDIKHFQHHAHIRHSQTMLSLATFSFLGGITYSLFNNKFSTKMLKTLIAVARWPKTLQFLWSFTSDGHYTFNTMLTLDTLKHYAVISHFQISKSYNKNTIYLTINSAHKGNALVVAEDPRCYNLFGVSHQMDI